MSEEHQPGDEPLRRTPEADHRTESGAALDEDRRALFECRAMVEALLLAAETPLSATRIAIVLERPEALVERALHMVRAEFDGPRRGIHLQEVGGGWQLRTNPAFGEQVLALYEDRPARLSRAAMETLAIVAYRQPLTRAEVEEIRGVDCSGVLRRLVDLELVQSLGRKDDIGRPHVYGTTERFLHFFGLEALSDLPTLGDEDLDLFDQDMLGDIDPEAASKTVLEHLEESESEHA